MEHWVLMSRRAIALYGVAYAVFSLIVAAIMIWAGALLAAIPWAIVATISGTVGLYGAISWQPKSTHSAVPRTEGTRVAQETQADASHPDQRRLPVGTAMAQ